MPKRKDQKPIPPETDSEQKTRVLLEGVQSELKVVAEGHSLIVDRLDRVDARLDKVEEGLIEVKADLHQVKGKLGRIEGQLDQLQDQVSSVLTDHESLLKALEAK